MSLYSDYVTKIYTCIKEASDNQKFTFSVFAEGPDALKREYTGAQEFVILRNNYARLFVDVMNSHFYDVSGGMTYTLKESLFRPQEVSASHSCYPKNLRRWMRGGTISRKRKCRAEFCALAWCWYSGWLEGGGTWYLHSGTCPSKKPLWCDFRTDLPRSAVLKMRHRGYLHFLSIGDHFNSNAFTLNRLAGLLTPKVTVPPSLWV